MESLNVYDIAADIAPHLRGGWQPAKTDATRNSSALLIDDATGYALYFRQQWDKPDRIEISGTHNYHGYQTYRTPPRITQAATRSPRDAARDIARRLLPRYVKWFEQVTADVKAHRARIERNIADYSAMRPAIDAIGAKIHTETDGDRSTRRLHFYQGIISGTIGTSYDARYDLSLDRLTPAEVVAVIELLAATRTGSE